MTVIKGVYTLRELGGKWVHGAYRATGFLLCGKTPRKQLVKVSERANMDMINCRDCLAVLSAISQPN